MNADAMQALLDLVEAARAERCAAILGEAKSQADALRAQSRAEARARLHQAFDEQRRLAAERIAAARARLATQRRLHEQRHTAALLALARERLPAELKALWAEASARQAWTARCFQAARRQLPAGDCTVTHAGGWPLAESAAFAAPGIAFVEDTALGAGLRIAAAGNVVDASLEGLLAGRAEFEARLLRELEGSP